MMVVAKVSTGVSIPKVVQLYLIAKMKEEGIMIDFNSKSGAIISEIDQIESDLPNLFQFQKWCNYIHSPN